MTERIVIPRLQIKVVADRAYCGRCDQPLGLVEWWGEAWGGLNLDGRRGHGWVYTSLHRTPLDDGIWEFRLKRKRHPKPWGPVGARADRGSIVVCPNPNGCGARQMVPAR